MLHHRIHDREAADRGERDRESFGRMLGDAVHMTALSGCYFGASRGAVDGVESIRSGGCECEEASPFASAPPRSKMSNSLVTARWCAGKVKEH
jgi:hypothetical protein